MVWLSSWIQPFCPATDQHHLLARRVLALMSAMNCASLPAFGSTVKPMAPLPALSAKATDDHVPVVGDLAIGKVGPDGFVKVVPIADEPVAARRRHDVALLDVTQGFAAALLAAVRGGILAVFFSTAL